MQVESCQDDPQAAQGQSGSEEGGLFEEAAGVRLTKNTIYLKKEFVLKCNYGMTPRAIVYSYYTLRKQDIQYGCEKKRSVNIL